ncbi:mechanosensitive ion channel domain-containing protein [Lysobacter sp. Root983]|uniref:mechanosensitive ion channel family protein n=1 Tax=Lysobacter sp. Root983 TaxID=1736613 RepID=UPI00070B7BE3|nr:mechanosensitive ion channel domain-containing protein [Lysobacter sp. Root983]KRD78719.1 hypothetical protein ASE43_20010 [Lysobacter sp. Root983]
MKPDTPAAAVDPELEKTLDTALSVTAHPVEAVIALALVIAALLLSHYLKQRLRPRLSDRPRLRILLDYLFTPTLALLLLAIPGPLGIVNEFGRAAISLVFLALGVFVLVRIPGALVELLFRPTPLLKVLMRVATVLAWAMTMLAVFGARYPLVAKLFASKLTLGNITLSTEDVVSGLVVGVIIVIVSYWATRTLDKAIQRSPHLAPNHILALSRIAGVLVWLVALMLIFSVSGINLAALAAFGGALGIGLGLGLQKLAASYVSGLIVLFEQSVRVGDNVSVGGVTGKVTRMTVRYTVIRTREGLEAIVPNDTLTGNTILNQSWSDRNVRLTSTLLVKGDTDTVAARTIFLRAVAAQPRVLRTPEPGVYVSTVTDKGIVLEAQLWIADIENGQHALLSDIYDATLAEFRAQGIELAVP